MQLLFDDLPPCSWPDLAEPNPKLTWNLVSTPMEVAATGSYKSRGVPSSDGQGISNPENNASQHEFHFNRDQSAVLAAMLRKHQISGGGANSAAHQFHFDHDQSAVVEAELRRHQISGGEANSAPVAAKSLLLHQQFLLQTRGVGGGLESPTGFAGAGDSGLLPMPLSVDSGDDVVDNAGDDDDAVQALYNGFAGYLDGTGQASKQGQHFQFHRPQRCSQNYGTTAGVVMSQAPAGGGGAAAQQKHRVRAPRGQATDPHSIAERLRRERIAERMKALQELVPNANKTDKASMLDEIIDYVKFLQLRVKGGGDCAQPSSRGRIGSNGPQTASTPNNHHNSTAAKLMEEDMSTAMQFLQGKGICLMPISLATAISAATSHSRNPITTNHNPLPASIGGAEGGGPCSPNMSSLTVQSATMGNGVPESSVKDAASVSMP